MATETLDDKKAGKPAEPVYDQSVVVDWLNTGCPVCHQRIVVDTPIYQPNQPGLYAALLFHYEVAHVGVTPPLAPHPDDEKALDMMVPAGLNPDGTAKRVRWRDQIVEAAALARRGVRT
jgi:hypothetical protein